MTGAAGTPQPPLEGFRRFFRVLTVRVVAVPATVTVSTPTERVHADDLQPTDGELVELVGQGSPDAFGVLVSRYARVVRGVLLARVGARADLDDMVQDTFLRAYDGLRRLRDGRRFGPFVVRIAQNLAIDCLRKKRRGTVSLDEVDLEPAVPTADDHHEDRLLRLRALVGSLPEALREAVLLFYFQNLSYARMADLLGITEAAVNQRLSRARRRLRSAMGLDEEAPR